MAKKTGRRRGTPAAALALRRAMGRRRFVHAYVGGVPGSAAGDAKAAALAAGLATTPGSAAVRGCLMLKDPAVLAAIERRLLAMGATAERIEEEVARVAFGTVRQLEEARRAAVEGDVDGLDDATASLVRDLRVTRRVAPGGGATVEDAEVRGHDKLAALALLARIRRMITTRLEHTGPGGGPIPHAVTFYLPASPRLALPAAAAAPTNGGG